MLHHHVESIISLCLESNSQTLLDHLFKDCNFLTKLLTADENPYAPDTTPELKSLSTRAPTRIGNIGHLTRLANKIVQASTLNPIIQNHLQVHAFEVLLSLLVTSEAVKHCFSQVHYFFLHTLLFSTLQ
jgi:serine/threonine-protein phosphatase 6 regulatory subunit 3